MDEDPIQLENDEFGCPRCKVQLIESKSSFYFQRVKAGSFDSLRCEFCGFFVLTENGFKESTKAIYKLGLAEPIEEEPIEGDFTMSSSFIRLELFHSVMSHTLLKSGLQNHPSDVEMPVDYTVTPQKYPEQTSMIVAPNFKTPKV